jgi:hypothetical protein
MKRYAAVSLVAASLFACSREIAPTAPNRPKALTSSVTGAAFTTINAVDAVDPITTADLCKNGNPEVNCNIYGSKDYVWLNGGPSVAYVGDGQYFFAVLQPGGQADPLDGAKDNLSDVDPTTNTGAGDAYTDRTFTVTGATVAYTQTPTHTFSNNKIRLMGYDDTENKGGVYILAICSLANGYEAVTAKSCKYDAFKVHQSGDETQAEGPTVIKDAAPAYDKTYTWGIAKSVVGSTRIEQSGGNATFNYQVIVTNTGNSVSNVKVTGTISVFNPNAGDMIATITDALDLNGGTACSVTGGANATLITGPNNFAYSCDLGTTLPASTVKFSNVATATWGGQDVGGLALSGGSADWTVGDLAFTSDVANAIDAQVSVTDLFNGGTATLIGTLVGSGTSTVTFGESPKTFTYSRQIPVLAGCHVYPNAATYVAGSGATGSSNASVTLCGPTHTGALTQGFWKGPNGTSLITNYCAPSGYTSLATYLSSLGGAAATGPFADAAGKSCSQLVTYFSTIFGKSATNMNDMIKLQMLATALDVYFSSYGYSTTSKTSGKTTIKPPSTFLPHGGIGTFTMDLTAICPMVDNAINGTALCKNNTLSLAFPWASQTVSGILTFASTAPTAGAFTNPTWYGSDRTKQEILKNVFDQINNDVAFAAP